MCLLLLLCSVCSWTIHRQRGFAYAVQKRADQNQSSAEETRKELSAKKKKKPKSARKSKSGDIADELAEEVDEEMATRTQRVANTAFPEYAITDLIYVLSYNPEFTDRLSLVRTTREQSHKRPSLKHPCFTFLTLLVVISLFALLAVCRSPVRTKSTRCSTSTITC